MFPSRIGAGFGSRGKRASTSGRFGGGDGTSALKSTTDKTNAGYYLGNTLYTQVGYTVEIGLFCPIALFCRQVSVKIVLFVIENNRIYLSIGLFCRFGSAIKRTK